MKILVPVKRVIDYRVNIAVKPDGSGVDMNNVNMSMNPFDEIAVEAALQLKEQGITNDVLLVSIGQLACQDTIRAGLALGADRGIHIHTEHTLEPLNIAKLLAAITTQEQADCVIAGKQAIDGDHSQVGQMLAALLGWPQATFAFDISIDSANPTVAKIVREVDGGLNTVMIDLPAVITTDLRLNQPRYPSLPNMMKAKQKPLIMLSIEQLNVTLKQHTEQYAVRAPSPRQSGIRLNTVDELVDALRNKEGLI